MKSGLVGWRCEIARTRRNEELRSWSSTEVVFDLRRVQQHVAPTTGVETIDPRADIGASRRTQQQREAGVDSRPFAIMRERTDGGEDLLLRVVAKHTDSWVQGEPGVDVDRCRQIQCHSTSRR